MRAPSWFRSPLRAARPAAALSASLACASLACTGTSDEQAVVTRFRANAGDLSYTSPFAALLDLFLASKASVFRLSASASSDRGAWMLLTVLTREQALAGQANLLLGAEATDLAQLRIDGSKSVQAEAGMLDLSFGGGVTSGTVTGATPDLLDGGFDGDLLLSCWVPLADLPPTGAPAPGIISPDGEMLILDESLASERCLPFRPLL